MSIRNGIVLFILLIALCFRVYRLGSVPPSASLDEVSVGYNAYSIAKTGADEYGTKFPLLLRAYDDWRPALYAYLVIPFLSIFGLSVHAVRLPSVLLGMLTILLVYYLSREVFEGGRVDKAPWGEVVGLVGALFLAISPWHIYISRLGHEANLGITLVVGGTYFFLRWVNTKKRLPLFLSFLFFALSLYGYQSEKIIAPLWLGGLLIAYWQRVSKAKHLFLSAGLCAALVALPMFILSLSPEGLTRFTATSVFTYHPLYLSTEEKLVQARSSGDIAGKALNHPTTTSVRIFIDNYLKHFKGSWLFTGKLIESHKVPYTGLLHWWDGILPVTALIFLIKRKMKKEFALMIFFVLSSFLPSALTTQAPQAMRSFTAVPFWLILSAIGFCGLIGVIGRRSKIVFLIAFGLIGSYSLTKMYTNYFVVFPASQSDSFQYALHDALQYPV